jgi:hypothetical protein
MDMGIWKLILIAAGISLVIALAVWTGITLHQRNMQQIESQALAEGDKEISLLQAGGLQELGWVRSSAEPDQLSIEILTPTSGEIPRAMFGGLIRLIQHAALVFEGDGAISDGDFYVVFEWPTFQQIILIDRPWGASFPPDFGTEFTRLYYHAERPPSPVISVVNLFIPSVAQENESFYDQTKGTIQAVCLGFASGWVQQSVDIDGECNVISANAALAWLGIGKPTAEKAIQSLGRTHLAIGDPNKQDYTYRFIPSVFDAFVQK